MLPRYLLVSLLYLVFASCERDIKPDPPNQKFQSLVARAGNNKLTAAERLEAARQAYDLSLQANDVRQQAIAMRLKAVSLLELDSSVQAMPLFRGLAVLADSLGDEQSEAVALHNVALILSNQSVYDSAIIFYRKAEKILERTHDSARLIEGKINTGIAYKSLGLYEQAFRITTEAVRMMECKDMPKEKATAMTTLGNVMKELSVPTEALKYHRKAMELRSALRDSAGIAGTMNNIGNVYKSSGQYTLALQWYFEATALKKRLGMRKSRITTIDNIADAYLGLGYYDTAGRYEQEALLQRDSTADKDSWMTSAERLARIYFANDRIEDAERLALVIARMANTPDYKKQQLENALLLEKISDRKGNYRGAHEYAQQAITLKDSLFNQELSMAISTMNVVFDISEKQKELDIAQKNVIIKEQENRIQRNFLFLMTSIILLLLVITYLLYLSSKQKKKSQKRTELLMSELNHRVINNVQIISGILNLQTTITNDEHEISIIDAGRKRIQAIGAVHSLLYQKEYTGHIDTRQFLTKVVRNVTEALWGDAPVTAPVLQIDAIRLKTKLAVPLGLIVNETLTNIFKYNATLSEPLSVYIALQRSGTSYELQIRDSGITWERSEARAKKSGLGLLLIDMLVGQIKGTLRMYREDGNNIQVINFTDA